MAGTRLARELLVTSLDPIGQILVALGSFLLKGLFLSLLARGLLRLLGLPLCLGEAFGNVGIQDNLASHGVRIRSRLPVRRLLVLASSVHDEGSGVGAVLLHLNNYIE